MKTIPKQVTYLSLIIFTLFVTPSCKRNVIDQDEFKPTESYSADVALKWLDMKARLIQQANQLQRPGFTNQYQDRYFAYAGITLYESVVQGMPAYQSLSTQLTDMPQMPQIEQGKEYHWAASANAAMASIHKGLLYNITLANRVAVDSLEQALTAQYKTESDSATIQRSIDLGREVAKRIIAWSETDGAYATYPPFILPVGPGIWVPTPPAFASATLVNYGDLRPLMPGVLSETRTPPPSITYSTNPTSDYYKSMKEVYDVSQTRTAADSIQALYWRSNVVGFYGILKKIATEQVVMLDKVALADCKIGIAVLDAAISGWKTKYIYNVQRPITFIRNVLGYSTWNSLFTTNANPDYPDALVPDYSASAGALSSVFGKNYKINTDGTNKDTYQGYTFNSFEDAAYHAGHSRLLAGVTTRFAVDAGLAIGFKTTDYMDKNIKFKR